MMKTCPCGGLLNPTVAGRLSVWRVHVRLYGFMLSLALSFLVALYVFLNVYLVDILFSLTCVLYFLGWCRKSDQRIWLFN